VAKALTLSLVIPAYNEEDHLKACLDSVAAQTVKPLEVFVVDNNSSDRTAAIAKQYDFVTLLHESQQGIAFARNAGFNAATGDVIGRIDADSRLKPGWVAYALRYFESNPRHLTHLLTGGSYFYDLKMPRFFGWIQGQIAYRANRFIMGYYIAWGSNMAFPAELWRQVRNDVHNDTDIHEDMDLSIHLHDHGYTITYHTGWKVGVDTRLLSRHTRDQHMKYLKLWPRTFERHHLPRAWMGWVGVYLVYVSYLPLVFINWIGGLFLGRRPEQKS